jgi:hypothetical protein
MTVSPHENRRIVLYKNSALGVELTQPAKAGEPVVPLGAGEFLATVNWRGVVGKYNHVLGFFCGFFFFFFWLTEVVL